MPGYDFSPGIRPSREDLLDIDASVAHPARVYDYWLGGTENYAADRAAGDEAIASFPGIVAAVRANRAFLARAVGYMAAAGVRQFLDIGTGIPTAGNTHEVAQRFAADARIVYVDNDPVVAKHATSLLPVTSEGATSFIAADVRDPDTILAQAQRTLDFSQPVAIMLLGILQLIPDEDDPRAIVTRLMDTVPSGSWLAVFHPASDILTDQISEVARQVSVNATATTTLRTKAGIMHFFDGLEFLEPGLVQVHRWRPGSPAPDMGDEVPGYAGLARKP